MSRAPLSMYRPGRKAPLDVAGLRTHCQQQIAAGQAAQTAELLLDLVESLAQRVDHLELRLARMAQAQWGRRSEKISVAQLVLALGQTEPVPQLETPQPAPDCVEAPAQPLPPPRPPAPKRPKSRQIPAHIPRTITVSEPAKEQLTCLDCGAPKTLIGTVCSEVLQWEPGGFRAAATHRHKYACRPCQSGVVLGPAPVRVLEQALPGAGLLAEVVVRKIKDHCPLERQSRIFTHRFGVPLSASTLGEWTAGTAQVLLPVAQRIRERGLLSAHLSLDDTPIRVLDPAHPKGVKRGHLWALVSDEPSVFYEYTPSWHGEPIRQLLQNYQGTLQSDGYSGLNELYAKESAPRRAGCLTHARRKFVNAYQAGDLRAAVPLQLIQQVYAVEQRATQDGCDTDQRLQRRQQLSQPLMQKLREQLLLLQAQAPPKTPLGQALTYARRQWETLVLFLTDGALRPDNNHTERALRPIGVGRKNWLFAGSDEGARTLAILYTVVGSCEQAGLRDPWHYLRDVLEKLSQGWPHARLDELLPLSWHAAHPQF